MNKETVETKKDNVPTRVTLSPDERKEKLIVGIKKTMVPAFISAVFAILLFLRFGTAQEKPWFSVIILVAFISYYIQKMIYPLIGVKVKEFETKDWIGVEFLIIIFLLVFWTILLNQ